MDGIPIEFISHEKLQEQSFSDKLAMIITEVKEGKILVLEESLSPEEERRLIQGAMESVDEDFPGIEFSTLDGHRDVFDKVIGNLFQLVGRDRRRGITVVGNSDVMDEIEKREDSLSFLARQQEEA